MVSFYVKVFRKGNKNAICTVFYTIKVLTNMCKIIQFGRQEDRKTGRQEDRKTGRRLRSGLFLVDKFMEDDLAKYLG